MGKERIGMGKEEDMDRDGKGGLEGKNRIGRGKDRIGMGKEIG